MRIFSTFTGIGGFEIGIQNAFNNLPDIRNRSEVLHGNSADTSEQPLRVVGYSEIDKYAIKVYERNFQNVRNFGDITKINAKELPDFDCLVGGFPCQAFSIAGKRRGFDDTRGTLFFDLARILREKQPRYFVFENVKGLLSHDQGNTFRTIITTIDELGYDCQWSVLNSKNFGVPQNRERVYIVGHLRGTPRPQVFPIVGTDGEDIKVVGSIPESVWPGRHEQIRRVHATDGISPTIPTAQGGGVLPKIVEGGNRQPFIAAQRGRYNADGKTEQKFEPRYDGISSTLTAVQKDNMVVDPPRIRRLTPVECERLQGFPDNWTAEGIDGPISDSQRYKMCGNAVTTNVVQAVFERILTNDQL